MTNTTRALVGFLVELHYEDIPEAVVVRCEGLFSDSIGAVLEIKDYAAILLLAVMEREGVAHWGISAVVTPFHQAAIDVLGLVMSLLQYVRPSFLWVMLRA